MRIKELLDLAELKLARQYGLTKQRIPDRNELLILMVHEINSVIEKEQWNWAISHLRPLIQTQTGVREYLLPEDFASNFLVGAKDGFERSVFLSDGSVDSDLIFEPPATFFSRTREGASNSKPTHYTVLDRSGRKEIQLDPAPDSNSGSHYTIAGAYKIRFANDVRRLEAWCPVPNHEVILYGTLLQIQENPDWRNRQQQGMRNLYLQEANNAALAPAMARGRWSVSEFDPGRI